MVRLAVFFFLLLGDAVARCLTPAEVWPKAKRWAEAFGLEPLLVYSLVWRESRFCPQAVGKKGEIGLGQIMPDTARFLGIPPSYLYDPDWNLYATAKYLRYLYGLFGSWEKALAAYNGGPGRMTRGTTPQVSWRYSAEVLEAYAFLKKEMGKREVGAKVYRR